MLRRISILAILLCALGIVPVTSTAVAKEGDIGKELNKAIDDYADAQEALDGSESKKASIKSEISDAKKKVKKLKTDVSEFASSAYMNGGLPPATVVLSTGTPDDAVKSLSTTGYLGEQSGRELKDLVDSEDDLAAKKDALDDEVSDAKQAEKKLSAARDDAAKAMAAKGGDWSDGPSPGNFPKAEPAPRNPDGSFPDEGCTVEDPTVDGGCISPRTEHAMDQAIIAGFTREISNCYRSLQDGGDHPAGKACDFTVGSKGGFAQGEAKVYGDHCAAWFVENAKALGVKGIIWYNQLWTPATDWGPYSGGNTGDPSLDHANHVHISMR